MNRTYIWDELQYMTTTLVPIIMDLFILKWILSILSSMDSYRYFQIRKSDSHVVMSSVKLRVEEISNLFSFGSI